jgi:S1-C subfamily serine protease
MNTLIKVALLTSLTTAALVYVILEWQPLRTEGSRAPEVTWAEPGTTPAEPAAPPAPRAAATFSDDEQNNIDIYRKYSAGVVNIASSALGWNYRYQVVPVEAGTGSGLILDTNGNIVTNFHVIEPALGETGVGIEVTLADKSKHQAKVVGTDENNDLAVIKIDAPKEKLVQIPFGKSSGLLPGQKVLAIGNPFGLERTLTTGIISATGRSIQAENSRIIDNIIQTDAAINPGNSGGPLLNSSGEVIGINSQIASPSRGSAGVGFAIPVDTVAGVVGDIINYGYVKRPWVGIGPVWDMAGYPEQLARRYNVPTGQGFMVTSVISGGPAAAAGIRAFTGQVVFGRRAYPVGGDILIAFEGRPITSMPELLSQIDHFKAGQTVRFTVLRGTQKLEIPVTLQEYPRPR